MAEVSRPQAQQEVRPHSRGEGRRPADPRQGVRGLRRPLGLRQDHDPAHDRRPRGHHLGRDPDRRHGGQRRAADGSRHRHGVPELRALSAHERRRQHGVRPEDAEVREDRDRDAHQARRRHPGHRRACCTASRASSRAASASAWRSAAPSCAIPRCSCSTSRSPTSTPSCACRCGSSSRSCTSGWAPRRSTSPTTRSRR